MLNNMLSAIRGLSDGERREVFEIMQKEVHKKKGDKNMNENENRLAIIDDIDEANKRLNSGKWMILNTLKSSKDGVESIRFVMLRRLAQLHNELTQ